ncbi:c-type cytochrome [Rhodoferax sp.]|uniref:c-type cytochrome n=1 Tax=Rhodoferax sp. TaxID=50421 RepID=UPI002851C99D|nr:c-type cytochrome [Rhodoferax sp.]MDR3367760.1 c-type cytochrome [Rhodoferax sp.]
MTIHPSFSARLAILTLCAATAMGCSAQTVKASDSASVDLDARLAQAQADPKLAQTLFATGAKVATFCANCHGASGNSTNPTIPNLAAQHPTFLLLQIRKFADGTRRNEFMEGLIKALSSDEKVGLALYYSAQTLPTKPSPNPALAAIGKDLFSKNCFRCHGDKGLGSDKFARIAGQQPEYLKLTLQRYKNGGGIRMDPLMAANTRLLSNADMDALVAYVSSLSANPQ